MAVHAAECALERQDGGDQKKAEWCITDHELIVDLPDDDPIKCEVLPVLQHLDHLALMAYRCRIVNRAFGSALGPQEIARLIPDEDIALLAALCEQDQIGDIVTYLRLFLKAR